MNASSPAATGPAGQRFEGQVGAHYLLSLLTGAEPRGLPGTTIDRVEFQRAAEGRSLDDIVVRAHDAVGNPAVLEIQVKRRIAFSPSDQEFGKAVTQIVETMRHGDFSTTRHELAIAVSRGSRKIDGAYQDVLTWARQIGDPGTFTSRIARPGAANEEMRTFVHTFRSRLDEAGGTADDETVWRLLSKLQILVFDFTAQGSASEDLAKERAVHALHPNDSAMAGELWRSLIELTIEIASSGGDRTRDRLIEDVKSRSFRLSGDRRHLTAREALAEASRNALADIVDRVGGVTLRRGDHMAAVRDAPDECRYVEIRGDAGVGKSGLLKHFAEQLSTEARTIVLSPDRTTGGGWTTMRAELGFDGTARDLLVDLASVGGTTLFIDGLDFFGDEERLTVIDLVREAAEVPGFTVIATARREFGVEEVNWLPAQALDKLGRAEPVVIGELGEAEIDELRGAAPWLVDLLADDHPAREVTRNLFRLGQLVRQPGAGQDLRTEIDMAEYWWRNADGQHDEGHRNRARLLKALANQALLRREPMDASSHPSTAVDALITSQTLRDLGDDRMAFRHDIFRDWAIANLLSSSPGVMERLPLDRPASGSLVRGVELAARMSLERTGDSSSWRTLLDQISRKGLHGSWRRAVLLSLVRSEIGTDLLDRVSSILLADRANLLRELIRTLMAVDVQPAYKVFAGVGIDASIIPKSLNVPKGPSWYRLIFWLLRVGEHLPKAAIPDTVDLYSRWSMGALGLDPITPELQKQLYRWLTEIETAREDFRQRWTLFDEELTPEQVSTLESNLRTGFLSFCYRTPSLAVEYAQSLRRRGYRGNAARAVLKFSAAVAQVAPRELAELTATVLIPDQRSKDRNFDEPFEFIDHEFSPPSPGQGPFFSLLSHAPGIGLKLIRRIIDHAVSFHTADQPHDSAAIAILHADGERVFNSLQSYTWSREWGGLDSCVTSALMALEAWAHRRIEDGESFETVLTDVLPPSGGPVAYLLVAVDLLISHWPESREAAMPFLACPELLCLDHQRVWRDLSDVVGTKSSATESVGPVSADSLKSRVSRRITLKGLLSRYAVSEQSELRDQLTVLLRRASKRLGAYGEQADLGDPSFMAIHALNLSTPDNWRKMPTIRADGTQTQDWQYVPPPAEDRHLASTSEVSGDQLSDWSIEAAIGLAVEDSSRSSSELVVAAVEWAQRAAQASNSDTTAEDRSHQWKIVAAAMIAMRDGDANLRAQHETWARSVFADVLGAEEVHVYEVPSGLRLNPVAIAFVGVVHLLRARVSSADTQVLLEVAARDHPAAAPGFRVVADTLETIDERLSRAILRSALASRVRPRPKESDSEERRKSQMKQHRARLRSTVDAELSWMAGKRDEPAWPEFPVQVPRLQQADPFRDEDRMRQVSQCEEYVDHRGAASWLRNASGLFDVSARPWLLGVARNYAEWTSVANGSELERDDQVDGIPAEWNVAYFDLLANCLLGMEFREIDRLALMPITSLPDEVFFDVVACFLRSVDEVYFGGGDLQASEAVRIRAVLADRLTSSGGWRQLRHKKSTSIEVHIGPAIAIFFLNDYSIFQPPRCYLMPPGIGRLDPFIPNLKRLTDSAPCFFVACCVLNLVEVSPRPTHLEFIATAVEAWLANHPDDSEFWVDYGIGRRLCALIDDIRGQQPPLLSQDRSLRDRVDAILSALVGLGVAEATSLEQVLQTL